MQLIARCIIFTEMVDFALSNIHILVFSDITKEE